MLSTSKSTHKWVGTRKNNLSSYLWSVNKGNSVAVKVNGKRGQCQGNKTRRQTDNLDHSIAVKGNWEKMIAQHTFCNTTAN